jgi:hypothetical protein
MLDLDFARDLVMTGVIFGAAALVWASWAHERPPKGVGWRIVLVVLQLAGVALMSFGIPVAVRYWETPTAIEPGGSAFVWYIALFWAEIIAIVAFSIYFVRRKKTELIAPLVLTVVGLHFVPLAFVFGQPIIMVAAILLTAAGVAAAFMPSRIAAPSFLCGILAAPILLILGTIALVAGAGALEA